MNARDGTVIYSLQIGRAFAALSVIVYHAALATRAAFPTMGPHYFSLFSLGHLGVDYFFVLSGFIIAHTTRNLTCDLAGMKRYLTSRIIRVYLPYWPVSLMMIAALAFWPSLSAGTRGHYGLLASLFLIPDGERPALSVAWTLQQEIVFYLFFGLCFFLLKRPMLIFLWAVPIAFYLFLNASRAELIIFGSTNFEFLFGVGACRLYHYGKLYRYRYLLMGTGIALIGFSCALLFGVETFAQYRIIAGFGDALIVLGLAYSERVKDFSKARDLIYLGAISYSIYLIHGPVISLFLRYAGQLTVFWPVAFTVLAAASVLSGMFYFRLIEEPLMAAARHYFLPALSRPKAGT